MLSHQMIGNNNALPDYLFDNPFVVTGYRIPPMSFRNAAFTLFTWHNETLNIWTHMFGLVWFLVSIVRGGWHWSIQVYHAGAATAFACSVIYHWWGFISRRAYETCRAIDFLGIIAVMWSMYVPWVVMSFERTSTQWVYLAIATLISLMSLAFVSTPQFHMHMYAPYRPVIFGIQGFFSFVPMFHTLALYHDCSLVRKAVALVFTNHILHMFGSFLYATKFPERWLPHTITDHMFSSHTIFHITVVAGLISFQEGLRSLERFRVCK